MITDPEGYGLISLEEAKKLKQNGYKIPCECYYLDESLLFVSKGAYSTKNKKKINHNKFDRFTYSAPFRKDLI